MKYKPFFLLVAMFFFAFTTDKPAYKIYNTKGKTVKYKKLIKKAAKADIIFIGEYHNNPINHWLEYEITKDVYKIKNGQVTLGAEMFESDNQLLIDEYFADLISKKSFEKECRLWSNYKTDYRVLLEFAKDSGINFIATNIPRRYASLVHKKGLEALDKLSDKAKQHIAPLPIAYDSEVACYANMLEMMGGSQHANPNLPKAQAVKDATMAYFIHKNFEKGKTFIHYNGAYHSDNYEGILWYLKKLNPELDILTISAVEVEDLNDDKPNEEEIQKADFVIVTQENLTKTY